jgi:hypothetical protein
MGLGNQLHVRNNYTLAEKAGKFARKLRRGCTSRTISLMTHLRLCRVSSVLL